MGNDFNNDPKEFEFQKNTKKVVKLKAFYTHAFIYAIGMFLFIFKEYAGFQLNFFPLNYLNGFVMVIWTTAFIVSAVDLFASFKIFGEEWEERKLKDVLVKKTKSKK